MPFNVSHQQTLVRTLATFLKQGFIGAELLQYRCQAYFVCKPLSRAAQCPICTLPIELLPSPSCSEAYPDPAAPANLRDSGPVVELAFSCVARLDLNSTGQNFNWQATGAHFYPAFMAWTERITGRHIVPGAMGMTSCALPAQSTVQEASIASFTAHAMDFIHTGMQASGLEWRPYNCSMLTSRLRLSSAPSSPFTPSWP